MPRIMYMDHLPTSRLPRLNNLCEQKYLYVLQSMLIHTMKAIDTCNVYPNSGLKCFYRLAWKKKMSHSLVQQRSAYQHATPCSCFLLLQNVRIEFDEFWLVTALACNFTNMSYFIRLDPSSSCALILWRAVSRMFLNGGMAGWFEQQLCKEIWYFG